MQVYTKKDGKPLSYQHAYNESGLLVSIEQATKLINGEKQKYYLFPNEQYELVLASGEIKTKHFRTKAETSINIGGRQLPYNLNGESVEHIRMKQKIAHESAFLWQGHTILLQNTKIEPRLFKSRYYADCMGELLDGTPCVVEVIKTSETEAAKKQFLKEARILTFEIHIDKHGNQINDRFAIYGNRQIEQIQTDIAETARRIQTGKTEIDRLRGKLRRAKDVNDSKFRADKKILDDQIREMADRLRRAEDEAGSRELELRGEIMDSIRYCRELQNQHERQLLSIRELESQASATEGIRAEIDHMEMAFMEVAKDCKGEWFGPKWIGKIHGTSDLDQIKYFCS